MDAGTEAIKLMFAPRIGLAYRVTARTVVRAGFGITNDPYPMGRRCAALPGGDHRRI
jgi:hypothetical protein